MSNVKYPDIDRQVCGDRGPRTNDGAPVCVKLPHCEHEKHRADESWVATLGPNWMEW